MSLFFGAALGGRAFSRSLLRMASAFCAIVLAVGARADEPYVTDDAAILERGTCQLEAGKRTLRGSREWYLLPACNLVGDVEVTLGRSGYSGPGDTRAIDHVVQAKGVWRAVEPNGYGYGWAAGGAFRRHPREGERRAYDYFATLIGSRSLWNDRVIVHANAGARWLRDEDRGALTGAVLLELAMHERLALLFETYDTSRSRRVRQAGVRWAIVPERLTLHLALAGEERDFNATRQWTIGLHVVAPVPRR